MWVNRSRSPTPALVPPLCCDAVVQTVMGGGVFGSTDTRLGPGYERERDALRMSAGEMIEVLKFGLAQVCKEVVCEHPSVTDSAVKC